VTTIQVLHVLPHKGGGGETYVSMLEAIPDFSHERFYLSSDRTPRSAMLSVPWRVPKFVALAGGADVIHVHGDAAMILASPVLFRRPSVVTTHGLHLLRRSHGSRLAAVRFGVRQSVAATTSVIATSASELSELTAVTRAADRSKLRVILNGVAPPPTVTPDERSAVRAAEGIPPEAILGLFAGELESRKEPVFAAGAATRVHSAGLPFVLAFAGDGPLASAVKARAGEAVRPLGFRADLHRLMAAADIFVQPSAREGMSLALLEAMSHGLAVVAADAAGNLEAVGEAGLSFPTGDEAALVAAITRLCTDQELRQNLGAAARERATTVFAAPRFQREVAATYRQILHWA
jgi:glycosyltransferase involved in cell wall biosynthesis